MAKTPSTSPTPDPRISAADAEHAALKKVREAHLDKTEGFFRQLINGLAASKIYPTTDGTSALHYHFPIGKRKPSDSLSASMNEILSQVLVNEMKNPHRPDQDFPFYMSYNRTKTEKGRHVANFYLTLNPEAEQSEDVETVDLDSSQTLHKAVGSTDNRAVLIQDVLKKDPDHIVAECMKIYRAKVASACLEERGVDHDERTRQHLLTCVETLHQCLTNSGIADGNEHHPEGALIHVQLDNLYPLLEQEGIHLELEDVIEKFNDMVAEARNEHPNHSTCRIGELLDYSDHEPEPEEAHPEPKGPDGYHEAFSFPNASDPTDALRELNSTQTTEHLSRLIREERLGPRGQSTRSH